MNKIIPFNKDITFDDKIGEIESIALDDVLKFEDKDTIKGELIIRGCNKYQDMEKNFSYPLPVLITIDSKYDTTKATIGVDDFYYEIINENILRVKIDLILDDLYYEEEKRELNIAKEDDLIKEDLNFDNDDFKTDISIEKDSDNDLEKDIVDDLFEDINEEKEYCIYRVYVVNDNDTIESILNKYKIKREELEQYNDLSNIKPGVKLIIPSIDE